MNRAQTISHWLHSLNLPLVVDGHWRDYYQLTKPKVVALLLLTALVGAALAVPGWPAPLLLLAALTGIGLMAAGAAAFNHLLDRDIDRQMARTRGRPLVRGRVTTPHAALFASSLALAGFGVLALWVNNLTAILTAISLVGYALIYTRWLKPATPQNIVIGGLAGAAPPLLGWTAMTGTISAEGLLLVMIVFTWTPPHFWALAIHRRDDYARAGVPMLPVTHGLAFTKTCVLLYTLLLALICLLPYLIGMSGLLYLLAACLLNLRFIYHSWRLKRGQGADHAMTTFRFSIVHLLLLFAALLVDHYLRLL